MLGFETLTLAPIDRRLIDAGLLEPRERGWLDAYHARVAAALAPLVEPETGRWLRAACAAALSFAGTAVAAGYTDARAPIIGPAARVPPGTSNARRFRRDAVIDEAAGHASWTAATHGGDSGGQSRLLDLFPTPRTMAGMAFHRDRSPLRRRPSEGEPISAARAKSGSSSP